MRRIFASTFGLALALSLAACSQGEGERCQVSSDCSSGLVCSEGSTGNGICRKPGTVQDASASFGEDAEPAIPDASEDAVAVSADAGVVDGSAGADGGSVDGVGDEGGVDAGAVD